MNNVEMIQANAALVIKTFAENNDVKLDYDEPSIEWMDGYIERNRLKWDQETAGRLSNVLGSFLGECIRRNFGGDWQQTENGLGIVFSDGNAVFPFNKLGKQIANGSDDSIAGFFNTISVLFNR